MNSLISTTRVLKSLSTCRIFWIKYASPELYGAWNVRAAKRNLYLKLNVIELKSQRHCELLAVQQKPLLVGVRCKSSKSSKKGKRRMLQEESDEEEDDPEKSDYEDEVAEEEDDDTQPKAYKDLEKVVSSFRFDLIMKAGLDIARNKVEDSFYSNKLRLNGEKLLKKSKVVIQRWTFKILGKNQLDENLNYNQPNAQNVKVKEGDVLDHLIGEDKEAETVTVMRVMVRKIAEDKTNTEKHRVILRRWKNLQLPRAEVFK